MEPLKEKNKEQFEVWYYKYLSIINKHMTLDVFYTLPFEMQIGVLLAFYDSLKYDVDVNLVKHIIKGDLFMYTIQDKEGVLLTDFINTPLHVSRNEAYKEAFKKANDLVNNNLLNQNK